MQNSDISNNININPHNYAAIYARKSHLIDTHSKETQLKACNARLHELNLQLYGTYYEEVTAVQKTIDKRKEFSALIEAARSGCFKTLIVSKLDRLVRRKDDWIETKRLLNKYDITLSLCDKPIDFDINSPEGNLTLTFELFAAMNEVNSTNTRIKNGKANSRKNGLYSSGRFCPLGYRKVKLPDIKNAYEINSLESSIVKYIFELSYINIMTNNTLDYSNILKNLRTTLEDILTHLTLNTWSDFILNSTTSKLHHYYDLIFKSLSNDTDVKNNIYELNNLITSLLKKTTSQLHNMIKTILINPVYAGLIYINPSADKASNIVKNSDNTFRLCLDKFYKTSNINGFIPSHIFEKVYCFILSSENINCSDTKEYLLKNKLVCSCGKKLSLDDNNFLSCKNSACKKYPFDATLKVIIFSLVTTILDKNSSQFNNFEDNIKNRLTYNNRTLYLLNEKQSKYLTEHVNSNNNYYKPLIIEIENKITTQLNLIASDRKVLSDLSKFKEEIFNFLKNNGLKSTPYCMEPLINYMILNQNLFYNTINSILKEVKISYEPNNKFSTAIIYEFKEKNSGYISKSFNF